MRTLLPDSDGIQECIYPRNKVRTVAPISIKFLFLSVMLSGTPLWKLPIAEISPTISNPPHKMARAVVITQIPNAEKLRFGADRNRMGLAPPIERQSPSSRQANRSDRHTEKVLANT